MRTISLIVGLSCLVFALTASGADLWKISINNQGEADKLTATGIEPIMVVKDGYLVLANSESSVLLEKSGLTAEKIAGGIERESLALDNRRDRVNCDRFPILYEEDGLRLFRIDAGKDLMSEDGSSLVPLRNENIIIRYKAPLGLNREAVFQADDLVELIDKVSYDSVYEYLHHLQAYDGRVAATTSNRAARDWIQSQLQSYGYTGAYTSAFTAYIYNGYKTCYNVIAYKQGTVFPNRQIVVGAHFDAVPGSPGADDNGTGTVGVLEIARALADVETEMSFVFVLFDAEEQGLNGSWNYASGAASRGDSIICMVNMDMIGHYMNDNYADLQYGPEAAYALLWGELADSLVDITGYMAGSASNSDHYPFTQYGYDVLYAAEHEFSNVYHTPRDSTTRINFDYCTRMIKATLASAYTINLSPLPVRISSVRDGGDGQSLQVNWYADDPGNIVSYHVYYRPEPGGILDSITVGAGETSAFLTGLTEGQQYRIYVHGFNASGYCSAVRTEVLGTPYLLPAIPQNYYALPQYRAISLAWKADNTELDFSHYVLIRDGQILPYLVTDTFFIDNDFSLGGDFHEYLVVAVDFDGNISDTNGVAPVSMRAATFEPGRILAVNRSNRSSPYIVNEVVTGEFMRDALDGYNYDYLSDTAASGGNDTLSVNLVDMLDYEVMILGGEAARTDDFANDPTFGGILDTIGYYLSIGGKVIIFGRWGNITTNSNYTDTVTFGSTGFNRGYKSYFHMSKRVLYLSSFTTTYINSDMVGAHSQAAGYPDIAWDSMATINHSLPWTEVGGVPCPTFGILTGGQSEVLYTYDSRNNFPLTEGKPVAWRYSGEDYQYVFFEMPLSFMDRTTAKTALLTALSGMLSSGPAALCAIEPDTLDESVGLPPTTAIYLGDFLDGKSAADVDPGSLLINGSIVPQSVTVQPSHPPFTGTVLEVTVATDDLVGSYGSIIDTVGKVYTVLWKYTGETPIYTVYGQITLIGVQFEPGDANGDWMVNVADAVYLINYVFKGGPPPDPIEAGDANCDGNVDVGDAVYLIQYVFNGGPPPGCD